MRALHLAVAGVVLLAACTTTRRLNPGDAIAPASRLKIEFTTPRDLRATHDTLDYSLKGVRSLGGKVESVRSDTLVLDLRDLSARRFQRVPRSVRVAIVNDGSARISRVRISKTRTISLFAVPALAVVACVLFCDFDTSLPTFGGT